MKQLGLAFLPHMGELMRKASVLASSLKPADFDRERWRGVVDSEFGIRRFACVDADTAGLIAADSSMALQNLRYHALWGMHCVSLYGLFNGIRNPDLLVGNGYVNYTDLMYESRVDLGSFRPYWMLEQQMNHLRIAAEYSALACDRDALVDSGRKVDYLLVDGSLKTNSENLSVKADLPTVRAAVDAQERLLKLHTVVSMAEDSHASDISSRFGLNMSNLMFFHLLLDDFEYVVDDGRFSVCYIKLPGKRLSYSLDECRPTTVRWEFPYRGFEPDLSRLASIWLKEDDLLHPQVYPLRIADYLTRRINAGGLLKEAAGESNAESEFRDLRRV
jgi:hypothetical protein